MVLLLDVRTVIIIFFVILWISNRTFLPVEAQTILPLTLPGMNVQAITFESVTNFLIFADINQKTIHRFDPYNLTNQVLQLDQNPSFIRLIKGEKYLFLVTLDRDLVVLYWDYSSSLVNDYSYFTCLLVTVDGFCHGNQWGNGQLDGYNRVWAVTTSTTSNTAEVNYCGCPTAVYRADNTKSGLLTADVAVQDFYSGGVEFTVDYRVMYTLDYNNRLVYSFNYDLPNGIICCPKVVFVYADSNLKGNPSSIAKDSNGNLWISSYGGGEVIQINPNTGELLRTVSIPASLVTSLAFGGPFQTTLFVGTATSNSTLEPLSGAVFRVTDLGVKGVTAGQAVVNNFCKPFYF